MKASLIKKGFLKLVGKSLKSSLVLISSLKWVGLGNVK
ncbi:hypothetical protein N403_00610 [Helicobacter pylori FD430]|nr:hypothetical protein N402_01110 [Helicobacter pylori FD423]EQL50533.1 hypothetical protein N403_00610 [Helicobacter pylori FD430]EQL66261.1 hypothetical protein N408_07665 [Helicobacter pylori FD703]